MARAEPPAVLNAETSVALQSKREEAFGGHMVSEFSSQFLDNLMDWVNPP